MSGTQSLFTMPQELSSLASKLFSSTTTSTSNTGATETQSEDTTPTPNIELSSPANGANKDIDMNTGANPNPSQTPTDDVTSAGDSNSPVSVSFAPEVTLRDRPESAQAGTRMRSCRSMSELEAELLAQLEAANKALESDNKSIQNVSPETDRTASISGGDGDRKGSDAGSIKSLGSQSSQQSAAHITDPIEEMEEERSPEQELVAVWSKVLIEWDNVVKKRQQYIKDLVYKGVPYQFRCLVWQYLCGAQSCPLKDKYSTYLKQTSACEKVIRRDIARTYPEHDFFREKDGLGQESLFNVMKAYSLHDREVGYCQGSAFIVGLLLMTMPEEEAFSVLIQMMSTYRMRELFKPSMAELGICMYQLEYLIQEHSAPLYQHFQAQSLHTSMYASGWFLTLFTTQLPLELSFRIMDRFLLEGMEVIFRVGISILLLGESDLLCMDMEGMLLYFQDRLSDLYSEPEAAQALLDGSNKVKYNARKMKRLEKEYSLLKSKENEDQVELRRLRSENRLLRHRIENLEKENVTLADRLIQGQVTLAQEAEVMFSIKRELSQLREQNKELYRSLSVSEEHITELKLKKQQPDNNRPLFNRSVSVPAGQQPQDPGLYNHVRDLHTALNDLHRSMSVSGDQKRDDIESNEKFQALQEELIAVKLREAESNLALRELSNHVAELNKDWQKQLERTPKDKLSKAQSQALHEELMTCKLRTAEVDTSNKQLRLKVMELETSGQIAANQVQRMMDENERLRGEISESKDRELTLSSELEDLKNKVTDIDSKSKEEAMISKINDAEQSQLVAELRQRIAELEISNQEFLATNEITNNTSHQQTNSAEGSAVNGEELLQYSLTSNQISFSTLDIHKGDFDSGSDAEDSEKPNDIDIALTNGSASSSKNNNTLFSNGESNGIVINMANNTKPKRLTSMEMDAEDEPL